MAEEFKAKVKRGDAFYYRDKNLVGNGFKFDDAELKKLRDRKKADRRRFGMEL